MSHSVQHRQDPPPPQADYGVQYARVRLHCHGRRHGTIGYCKRAYMLCNNSSSVNRKCLVATFSTASARVCVPFQPLSGVCDVPRVRCCSAGVPPAQAKINVVLEREAALLRRGVKQDVRKVRLKAIQAAIAHRQEARRFVIQEKIRVRRRFVVFAFRVQYSSCCSVVLFFVAGEMFRSAWSNADTHTLKDKKATLCFCCLVCSSWWSIKARGGGGAETSL